MAAQYHNEAYDLSLFEPKQLERREQNSNIIELPKERLEKNRRNKVRPLHAIATFFVMAVIVGIVGTMVYSQVQLTELTDQLNAAVKQYEESQSVYTQLKMRSDSQLSLQTVETYAKEELGMKKINQNQVVCVSLSEGDQGEVLLETGGDWWSSAWNYVQNLLS